MTAPLLVFALDGPGQERLVVEADGIARYLLLTAAHPQWADRAGLFQTRLSSARLGAAEAVAADLLATPPKPRGRTGPVVTAALDDAEATHPLDGPGEAATDLLSDLIEVLRDHPLAVVQLGAEVINGVDLRLRWRSVGTEPVDLRLARDSCRVAVRSDGAWRSVWSSTPSTRLALVAAPDGFVDGVNSPATLEPGATARAMLPGVLAEAGEAWDQASVDIAGWLEVAGSGDEDDRFDVPTDTPGLWPIHLRAGLAHP